MIHGDLLRRRTPIYNILSLFLLQSGCRRRDKWKGLWCSYEYRLAANKNTGSTAATAAIIITRWLTLHLQPPETSEANISIRPWIWGGRNALSLPSVCFCRSYCDECICFYLVDWSYISSGCSALLDANCEIILCSSTAPLCIWRSFLPMRGKLRDNLHG